MAVRIKIISDCHIGIPGERCNDFHISDEDFIEFLEYSRKTCDIVILNGDLWELWESETHGELGQFSRLAVEHQPLFRYIRRHMGSGNMDNFSTKKNIFYIAGNHDRAAERHNALLFDNKVLSGLCLTLCKSIRVQVSHGHECDPANHGRGGWVGRCIAWCVGILEKCVHKDADEALGSMVSGAFIDHARKALAAYPDAHAVVFGHTHEPGVYVDENDRVYANSGRAAGPRCINDVVLYSDVEGNVVTISVRKYDIVERESVVIGYAEIPCTEGFEKNRSSSE